MLFRFISSLSVAALSVALMASQNPYIQVPSSSVEHPSDLGLRAHTNVLIWTGPPQIHGDAPPMMAMQPSHGPTLLDMFTGPSGYHPSDVTGAYGVSGAGSGAIAIVDAYDYPTALKDFNYFCSTFGLPTEPAKYQTTNNAVFQVIYAQGSKPSGNSGWNVEEALDIEWAHAMAPNAKIYLVEANSNSFADLLGAVDKARSLKGVTQISMSWGGGEFSGETSYDTHFVPHVWQPQTFFASSGDGGAGVIYPSASPYIVAAGGTSLYTTGGVYGSETGWGGSGGGPSSQETIPSYQSGISGIVGGARGVPDISAVADPNTGVAIRWNNNWYVVGGTSVSSPVLAGIANAAGTKRAGNELSFIYGHTGGFHDIIAGSNGYPCMTGWDFVTGWGSPISSASL